MSVSHLLAASATSMGPGRALSTVAGVLALAGVVLGARALARPAGSRRALVAVALGAVGIVVGGLVAITADGGLGTGNGLGGGVVAAVAGAIGVILGALALTRSRRTD